MTRWPLFYSAAIAVAAACAAACALSPSIVPYLIALSAAAAAVRFSGCFNAGAAVRAISLPLIPLYFLAALAPINPTFAVNNGWRLALLAVVLGRFRGRFGWPAVAAACLAAWATFDAAVSNAPFGVFAAGGYWSACAMFIACRALAITREKIFAVALCYLGGCIFAAVESITQPVDATTDFRPTIEGVNINYAAYAMLTGVVLNVALITVLKPPRRAQIMAWALAAVLVVAISRADTRAALGAIAGGLIYLLVRRLSRGGGLTFVAIATPIALATVAFDWLNAAHLTLLETPFDRQSGDLSGRLEVWPLARQAWVTEPIFGLGPRVFPLRNPIGIPPHNLILDLGVDIGAVGTAIFALVMVSAFGSYRKSPIRHLAALLLLTWLPLWMTGIWAIAPAAWIVLALWSGLPSVTGQAEATCKTSHLESAEFQLART